MSKLKNTETHIFDKFTLKGDKNTAELYINGEKVNNVTKIKVECEAGCLSTITVTYLTLMENVDIEFENGLVIYKDKEQEGLSEKQIQKIKSTGTLTVPNKQDVCTEQLELDKKYEKDIYDFVESKIKLLVCYGVPESEAKTHAKEIRKEVMRMFPKLISKGETKK